MLFNWFRYLILVPLRSHPISMYCVIRKRKRIFKLLSMKSTIGEIKKLSKARSDNRKLDTRLAQVVSCFNNDIIAFKDENKSKYTLIRLEKHTSAFVLSKTSC